MTFKIFISSAIVSVIVTAIGNIIIQKMANRSAEKTARDAAANEIEKMQLTWNREDTVSSDDEFAEMAAVVSKWSLWKNGAWEADAIEKIASIRAKETGVLGDLVDELYNCVNSEMYEKADKVLTKAINERRRLKSLNAPK